VNGYRTMPDTDIVSDLMHDPQGRAAARLREHGEEGICASIITAAELRITGASAQALKRPVSPSAQPVSSFRRTHVASD